MKWSSLHAAVEKLHSIRKEIDWLFCILKLQGLHRPARYKSIEEYCNVKAYLLLVNEWAQPIGEAFKLRAATRQSLKNIPSMLGAGATASAPAVCLASAGHTFTLGATKDLHIFIKKWLYGPQKIFFPAMHYCFRVKLTFSHWLQQCILKKMRLQRVPIMLKCSTVKSKAEVSTLFCLCLTTCCS